MRYRPDFRRIWGSIKIWDGYAGTKERYQEKIESTLNDWGEEIEKIRKKADLLGAEEALAELKKGVEGAVAKLKKD